VPVVTGVENPEILQDMVRLESDLDQYFYGYTTVTPYDRVRYLYKTQQTQRTNIHAISMIRTRESSNLAALELRLKTRLPESARDHIRNIKYQMGG
jgi:hypothetical protein